MRWGSSVFQIFSCVIELLPHGVISEAIHWHFTFVIGKAVCGVESNTQIFVLPWLISYTVVCIIILLCTGR